MDPLASLLEGLTLTRLDEDRFEGRAIERTRPRMFGGDLLAQSLLAAGMTTKGRRCHSLHVSFLAPGDPAVPLEYRVRRLRDGRRFAQRQLSAWQGDREILIASASFTSEPPESHVHQHEAMPEVPGPEGLSSELDQRKAEVEHIVYGAVSACGGSISAEHGIGFEKRAFLGYTRSAGELELMRTLKAALDPRGVLNRGRVLPWDAEVER